MFINVQSMLQDMTHLALGALPAVEAMTPSAAVEPVAAAEEGTHAWKRGRRVKLVHPSFHVCYYAT